MFRVILVEDRFKDFGTKRGEMFRELIKRAWSQDLDNKDLNSILTKMQENMAIKIKKFLSCADHIRLLMGLDPRGDEDFSDELEKIKEDGVYYRPMIKKIWSM